MHELDAELAAELENALIAVKFAEYDAQEPGVGDHLEATETGRRGHVDVAALEPNAVTGRLHVRIGFGVDGPHAVTVLHHVPLVVAVPEAADRPVVAGRQNHLVA